jgi:uncharacterized small protein (DUF1192 family)
MEEELPRPTTPPILDKMGVAELRAYVAQLQAEIARAEAMIKSKQSVRGAADSLFKKQ